MVVATVDGEERTGQFKLTFPDWRGLIALVDETFAHCADGTTYWGHVLAAPPVQLILDRADEIKTQAENCLFQLLIEHPHGVSLGAFLRKEIVNWEMRIKIYVEYDVD